MKQFHKYFFKKHPNIKPRVYNNPERKLHCIEIDVEKNCTIDLFFKNMTDLVTFIQRLDSWLDTVPKERG